MAQTCRKCLRVNPAGAFYCFYDGMALPGQGRNRGPLSVGSQPFLSPFIFPSGRQCRNFDELAMACHEEWPVARDLMKQGVFEKFLEALGRADLAQVARESALFPDGDRGLDRFLGELPTKVVGLPKLVAEPLEVNLGVLRVGEDRHFDLHLENRGMRLLFGSVLCDRGDWLALGEAPGVPEKLFQFGSETILPVQIKGQRLHAHKDPLEGRLVVESNGGTETIRIRADVPPLPFPEGVLSGALNPRQVAEKAKAAPKEAAAYFEQGAVARWYKDNGWTYPVRGPAASGLGAVQQFFEALGLTPPPKVDISERFLTLSGNVGDSLNPVLEVKSEERRPVYAHATSSQPWLKVGRIALNGRLAIIPLHIPAVPDREGETLSAQVVVQANGNQRFVVPVTLTVGGNLHFETPWKKSLSRPTPFPSSASEDSSAPEIPATQEVDSLFSRLFTRLVKKAKLVPGPKGVLVFKALLHLLPLLSLLLVLVGILLADSRPRNTSSPGSWPELIDPNPCLGIQFDERMQFGLTMLRERDPSDPNKFKRLTSFENNRSNNSTCLRIDGFEYLLGQNPPGRRLSGGPREAKLKDRNAWDSVYEYPDEKVRVTQTVELVPGEQSRLIDTCLVRYMIENRAQVTHKVGLRVLLDTFIGANDGVPFIVPGHPGLLDKMRRFEKKDIPDYIQALENPDLTNPGTVAHLALKLPDVEPIDRLLIGLWPGANVRWDWVPQPMDENPQKKDSSVTMYWAEKEMKPGNKRHLAYAYGLNTLSHEGQGPENRLALTVGGDFRPEREFTVTAYLRKPQAGQVVRLNLPPEIQLAPGAEAEQGVDRETDFFQVSWRVQPKAEGDFVLEACSGGARVTTKVKIRSRTIY